MTGDGATLAFYEEQAPRYTLSFGQSHSRHLDSFLDRLHSGAQILELGCGGGRDAARMTERGFTVDATDGVAAMVRKARERTGLAIRQMRFEQLDASESYDAVWAHACLLHVARTNLPEILNRIHRALRPGGWHYASYKLGDGEGRDRFGRLHNFPDPRWLEDCYAVAGFATQEPVTFRGEGADGDVWDWLAMTVRKERQ